MSCRNFFFLIVGLLFGTTALAQDTLKSTLVSLESEEPLAYVNIGVKNKGIGTVTNFDGEFELFLPAENEKDSIVISLLGYRPLQLEVAFFRSFISAGNSLALEPEITLLPEVILTDRKLKSKVLGNTTEAQNIIGGFTSNLLGSELGVAIKIKRSPTYIDNLGVSIVTNKYGAIKFRVNVYDMSSGEPGKSLIYQNIIVEADIENGVMMIDLREYGIVAYDDFLITLEWIEALGEDGLYFSAAFLADPFWARQTSQDVWIKKKSVGIGMSVGVRY